MANASARNNNPSDRGGKNPMKAAFIEQYGGPEVLKYGDLPDPVAGPGEVVIDVVAASVNGADWKVRVGQYKQSKLPFALGRDFSGVISAIGEGVADLKVGDAVFGVCDAGQKGAYAEKIAVKAAIVAKKPDGLSHVNAAALALTGLTAMSAIEDTLKLQPGETGSPASPFSLPNILAPISSRPRVQQTTNMCAGSEPMKSSTTTPGTSLRL
jgi:D-arabinose 1-dehydrogenase-like Zn-dependent alcohol dehydrogenase